MANVSIVIPAYNEQDNVAALHSGIKEVMKRYNHEIIFVEDGNNMKYSFSGKGGGR